MARNTAFVNIAPRTAIAALACVALGSHAGISCSRGPHHPNVVLISIDMLRPDHLGCYGYSRATSPNLDQLAREGVVFENHISSSSWTLPAHAALFTSLPDSLHGCVDTDCKLSDDAHTLAKRFAESGYTTAGFFSGPYLHPAFGLGQGFETYEDCTSYHALMDGHPASEWAMDETVMRSSHEDVTNPIVWAAFSHWFEKRGDKPFFLFLHLWDPHFDFVPPPPYDKRFDPDYQGTVTGRGFFFDESINATMPERDKQHLLALYDGEIAWTDEYLGKLRDALEHAGILEDTILAVTSDHGTEFFEHGSKGHRQTLYDEVIRIPLVVRTPHSLAPRRIAAQTRSIDVGPTLLELAGLPAPNDIVGTSLVGLARGAKNVHPEHAVSELFSVGHNLRSVRTREWKFIDSIGSDHLRIYDLVRDPSEQHPKLDLEGSLGQRASSQYLGEVAALRAFHDLHPETIERSAPPDSVKHDLRRYGYTGGDSSEDPAPPKTPANPPTPPVPPK